MPMAGLSRAGYRAGDCAPGIGGSAAGYTRPKLFQRDVRARSFVMPGRWGAEPTMHGAGQGAAELTRSMARAGRLERPTDGLEDRCSIH